MVQEEGRLRCELSRMLKNYVMIKKCLICNVFQYKWIKKIVVLWISGMSLRASPRPVSYLTESGSLVLTHEAEGMVENSVFVNQIKEDKKAATSGLSGRKEAKKK